VGRCDNHQPPRPKGRGSGHEGEGIFKGLSLHRSKFPAQGIAAYLLENGVENRRAIVMENLTYPDERFVDADLDLLTQMGGFGLCVMVIKKEAMGDL